MALHAVAITKTVRYAGATEEMDNIYYYEGPLFQLGDTNYERLVNAVADAERPVHSTGVTFKTGRIWSAGGSIVDNVTLGLYDLTGKGTMLPNLEIFSEAAILVEWECSRPSVLGRKVYLRKYIRSQAIPSGVGASAALGRELLDPAYLGPYKTYADAVQNLDLAGTMWELVSPTGRPGRSNGNGVVDTKIRTREFRRN